MGIVEIGLKSNKLRGLVMWTRKKKRIRWGNACIVLYIEVEGARLSCLEEEDYRGYLLT